MQEQESSHTQQQPVQDNRPAMLQLVFRALLLSSLMTLKPRPLDIHLQVDQAHMC